jgi:hypothetical protein
MIHPGLHPVNNMERIGAGYCGSVWSSNVLGGALALKRENGAPGRSLKNEVLVQSEVYATTTLCPPSPAHVVTLSQTLVPRCLGFLEKTDTRWSRILAKMPPQSESCHAMVSEKIQSVSEASRRSLVERNCLATMENIS